MLGLEGLGLVRAVALSTAQALTGAEVWGEILEVYIFTEDSGKLSAAVASWILKFKFFILKFSFLLISAVASWCRWYFDTRPFSLDPAYVSSISSMPFPVYH